MAYKTILVHLNNPQRARRLLGAGLDLASRFDAHLIGLHVFPAQRLTPPLPLPFGGEIAAQIRGSIKKEDEAVKAVFDEAVRNRPVSCEWRSITSEHQDPALVVMREGRAADLVIASQADPNWQFSDILDFPDRLAMGCGRPVWVVPLAGRPVGFPDCISVAWSNRREAARALFDAMPLLKAAKRVHLMTIDEGNGHSGARSSLESVARTLERHGIKPVVARLVAGEFTTGEEIRVRAIDENADLLVMGCYGHSRLRELALGGVTRHMLREMTIPVLLSH